MTIAFLGFVGPLVLLLLTVGVSVTSSLAGGLLVLFLGILGRRMLELMGLVDLAVTQIGKFVVGATVALAATTLCGLVLRPVLGQTFAWLVLPLLVFAIARKRTRNQPLTPPEDQDTPAIVAQVNFAWLSVHLVLGVSSPFFVALGLLHLLIWQSIGVGRRRLGIPYWVQWFPIWISHLLSLWISESLGWRSRSAWAFSLPSWDIHNWVAGAWSVTRFGWTADPFTYGVDNSYHFLGQAMAGLISSVSGLPEVSTVTVLVQSLLVATTFFAIRALFDRGIDKSLANFVSAVILLSGFSPLEPITVMYAESFTHLASVAFLGLGILALKNRFFERSRSSRVTIMSLVVFAGLAKSFTGSIFLGLLLMCVVVCLIRGDYLVAKRIFWDFVAAILIYGILALFIFVLPANSSVFRLVIGFGELSYRWGFVGGPSVSSPVAIFYMFITVIPLIFCVHHALMSPDATSSSPISKTMQQSLAVSSIGLMVLGFLVAFPPAGYAERYFFSTALMLGLVAGLPSAVSGSWHSYWGSEARRGLRAIFSLSLVVVIVAGVTVTARLWWMRYWFWPTDMSFEKWYPIPMAVSVLVALVFLTARTVVGEDAIGRRGSLTLLVALFVLLSSTSQAAANVAYGARGPLKTFVAVLNGDVTWGEFGTEIKESSDRSGQFRTLIENVRQVTPSDGVIASNFDVEAQMYMASAAERRMWWPAYAATVERRDSRLTSHIRWRGLIIKRFADAPFGELVSQMRACGVTHYVVDLAQTTRNPEDYEFPDLSRLVYVDQATAIVELAGPILDSAIPDPEWLKWCR